MKEMKTKELLQTYIIAITIMTILLCLFKTRFGVDVVSGPSMEPTFYNKEVVLYDVCDDSTTTKVNRNDVILFDSGNDGIYIKRVIAIAGDHIVIKDGEVYLNENELEEKYIKNDYVEGNVDLTIPSNSVFVMGDNRDVSYDSREFGVVDVDDITGIVLGFFSD